MNTVYAGEQMLSEIVVTLFDLFPGLDTHTVKSKLSKVISRYKVTIEENQVVASDFPDKIHTFLSSKRVEGLSDQTLNGYKLELNLFAKKNKKLVADITSADIRVYLGELEGLKSSTVGKKLNVLKSFFGFLTGEEIIRRDPTTKIKQPKEEKRIPKALTIEELEMLRESCQTIRQRAFIEILYATGCRLSEVHQINRQDINFQSMSCRIIGKGNKEREVYFSFKAIYHLKKYLFQRNDEEDALMVTERKPYRRLSKRGIQREINVIAKNAGLEKKVTPHVMRHTFATLTLNNGADLVAVQELLGHSSSETTLRYARITEERKREQHKKFLVQ
jgi:integrase/recombinase XerD